MPLDYIKALCESVKQVTKVITSSLLQRVANLGIFTAVTFGFFGGSFKLFLQVLLFKG